MEASIDLGHGVLETVGLVPAIGILPDGINAIWYYAEGDLVNGHLSAISIIPVLGYGANAVKIARNTLRYAGGLITSPLGLKFAERTYFGGVVENAFYHVYKHANDIPNRRGVHGVFNEVDDIVGLMDDAYAKILSASPDVVKETFSGDRVTYIVNMRKEIGWEGGADGSGQLVTHLLLVLDRHTMEVITSYPTKFP